MKRTKDRAAPNATGTHPTQQAPIPQQSTFLDTYPEYADTAILDHLRATEYRYLDAKNHLYLDYTGGGLPAETQIQAHADRVRANCFGNPHSANPTSAASTELVEQARDAVLRFFNASPDEYTAIFADSDGRYRQLLLRLRIFKRA